MGLTAHIFVKTKNKKQKKPGTKASDRSGFSVVADCRALRLTQKSSRGSQGTRWLATWAGRGQASALQTACLPVISEKHSEAKTAFILDHSIFLRENTGGRRGEGPWAPSDSAGARALWASHSRRAWPSALISSAVRVSWVASAHYTKTHENVH